VRFNKKYAEKLEKKAARKEEQKKEVEKPAQSNGQRSNPFSVSSRSSAEFYTLTSGFQLGKSAEATSPFGLGSQIFGGSTEEEEPIPPEPEFEDDDSESDTDDDSETSEDTVDEEAEELAEALAKTSLNDVYAVWNDMPAYPPLYMSTVSEYLPPEPKVRANIKVDDGLGDCKTKGGLEAYENSLNVDEVFSRFIKRVECEGEQCIRCVNCEAI
jgi:pre-rRNA-processing protein TSR4